MRTRFISLSFVALVAASTLVYSTSNAAIALDKESMVKTRCQSSDDSRIDFWVKKLESIDQLLPNIPPEETKYLELEYALAMRIGMEESKDKIPGLPRSSKMLNSLSNRPLYKVWELRKVLVSTREEVDKILAKRTQSKESNVDPNTHYPKDDEAEKLYRAINASYQLAVFSRAVEVFSNSHDQSTQPILTSEQLSSMHISSLLMPIEARLYMHCKLAKIIRDKN